MIRQPPPTIRRLVAYWLRSLASRLDPPPAMVPLSDAELAEIRERWETAHAGIPRPHR